jgi:hypothetical protein
MNNSMVYFSVDTLKYMVSSIVIWIWIMLTIVELIDFKDKHIVLIENNLSSLANIKSFFSSVMPF